MPEEREWTVMFYFASDNALAPGIVSHLKALKNAGYHPQVNVLAQFDPHTVNTPVHFFEVNRVEKLTHPNEVNIGFRANDSFIRNMVTDKIWDDEITEKIRKQLQKRRPEIDFKAPRLTKAMCEELPPAPSLTQFLTFCSRHYPARHYMLFIVGHGVVVGNDLFLIDEHVTTKNGDSESEALSLRELAKILAEFKKELPNRGQFELVGFHSCSMSGAEVAFQLKGTANYMLAAQGPQYVGSWPYQQILIRLFNELSSSRPFSREDLRSNGLVDRLMRSRDPASRFFRNRFNENGKQKLLRDHLVGETPKRNLVTAMLQEFDTLLADPKLCDVPDFRGKLSPTTRELFRKHRALVRTNQDRKRQPEFDEQYLKWLNRRLLLEGFPRRVVSEDTSVNIKNLFVKIFHHVFFNSFDFMLAGYSSDLTLLDLKKAHNLEKPVLDLVSSLKSGLKSSRATKDPLIRDLIILAHWEAQSFYEEKYTDLYDFCFRLKAKCDEAKTSVRETQEVINKKIVPACRAVMEELKRGTRNDDDRLIVRCEFNGPAYQYSHGLSVFFPWSEPVGSQMWDKQYDDYKFTRRTKWQEFLRDYFTETMREPQGEEKDDLDKQEIPKNLDRELLELLSEIHTKFFSDADELTKGGSKDPLGPGKGGSKDPTGGDCECGSIKNYPPFTSSRKKKVRESKRPAISLYKQIGREIR
jgi:hypothetical protein